MLGQLAFTALLGLAAGLPNALTESLEDRSPSVESQVADAVRASLAGKLVRRDDGWESADGGNTYVRMSDKRINLGFDDAEDLVFAQALDSMVYDHCSEIACHGGEDFEWDIEVISTWWKVDKTIKIDADATFSINGGGTRYDVGFLAGVAMELAKSEHETKWNDVPDCSWGYNGFCEDMADKEDPVTQYSYPQELHVRVEGDDGRELASLNLYMEYDEADEEDGLCGLLTGLGSTVAGVIDNSPLGTAYDLASLFCA